MRASARQQLKVRCVWTVKERRDGLWIPVLKARNVFTNYGLSQLASSIGGGYTAPQFLIIDSSLTTLFAAASLVATSIQTAARVDIAGDTGLVLNPGGATQETVTFSAPTGSGPYTYTVSALVFNHLINEPVVRAPRATDDMTTIISEQQYDSVNAPNARMQAATGYSPGNGQWTSQFFFPGALAQFKLMTLGLSELGVVGTGHLHNHVVLGYDHSANNNDLEVDVTLTLTN